MSSVALTAPAPGRSAVGVGAILFLSLFASQAGLIVLSPVLAQVAADLDVSTAAAGQLRTVAGVASGTAALILAFSKTARRATLRDRLIAGAALLAVASLASAAAPGYAALAAAQVLVGVAVALLVTAATAAAGEWSAPEQRRLVLSWTLSGMPAAWIVGMPLIGVLGAVDWRYAWIALPFVAAGAAGLAAAAGPRSENRQAPNGSLLSAFEQPSTRRWLVGELLAGSAWTGTLVYSGALFSESYGISSTAIGVALALVAIAFVGGTVLLPRLFRADARVVLIRLALALAASVALFGAVRPGVIASTVLLSVAAFLAGGRVLAGNAFGLDADPPRRLAVMGARTAANQYGYFVGSAVGGVALAQAGYTGLGIVLGVLFAAAAMTLALGPVPRRASVRLTRWSTASSALSRWSTALRRLGSAEASNEPSLQPCY